VLVPISIFQNIHRMKIIGKVPDHDCDV
jgi:hypothetical protein